MGTNGGIRIPLGASQPDLPAPPALCFWSCIHRLGAGDSGKWVQAFSPTMITVGFPAARASPPSNRRGRYTRRPRSRRVVLKTITADRLRPLAGISRLRALGFRAGRRRGKSRFHDLRWAALRRLMCGSAAGATRRTAAPGRGRGSQSRARTDVRARLAADLSVRGVQAAG